MTECTNMKVNSAVCPCTYGCDLKGRCCEWIRIHRLHNELPACYFPPDAEKTFDRSIQRFLTLYK